jgi:hypothetical protein
VLTRRRQQRLELCESLLGRITAFEVGCPLELGYEGKKGAVLVVRRTEITEANMGFFFEPIEQGSN